MSRKHKKRHPIQVAPVVVAQPIVQPAVKPQVERKSNGMFRLIVASLVIPFAELIIIQLYIGIQVLRHYGWRNADHWGLYNWLKYGDVVYMEAARPAFFIVLITIVVSIIIIAIAYLKRCDESH